MIGFFGGGRLKVYTTTLSPEILSVHFSYNFHHKLTPNLFFIAVTS